MFFTKQWTTNYEHFSHFSFVAHFWVGLCVFSYLSPIQPGLQWEHLPWTVSQWWPSLQVGHTSWQFSPKKPLEQSWSHRVPFQPLSHVMQRPSVTLQGCWPLQCPHLWWAKAKKISFIFFAPTNPSHLNAVKVFWQDLKCHEKKLYLDALNCFSNDLLKREIYNIEH